MSLKEIKLSIDKGKRSIDPIELFTKLTLRGSIKNIWEPQADALKDWHKKRNETDIVVQMNTGGGKTLVGLLIAQSLTNENKAKVLYICSNNQLIEQTLKSSNEIGLFPATRYASEWNNRSEFDSGNTFCITNYATVFNGKSIFFNDDIDAIIFDDAHVSENLIRDHFTLRVNRSEKLFNKILNLFRRDFINNSLKERFLNVCDGQSSSILFLPMFNVFQYAEKLRKILIKSDIQNNKSMLFAWEHLKDHLSICTIIFDGNNLEITPAILPLSQLNYFQKNTRHIYLTATIPSRTAFARTFNIRNPKIIQPSGKSGDAQRLFVFIDEKDNDKQRNVVKSLVKNKKSCVIIPSYNSAKSWIPPANIYNAEDGQDEIERFCNSKDNEMLALIARYDGIDLPGEACKILILDRLPYGENILNRFIDENIRVETIRISHIATRIIQAIGRIFRSNTDHGVVFLVSTQLQSWMRTPKNHRYLPKLLQQQLLLSNELSKKVKDNEITWTELIEGILNGEKNWDKMYNNFIDEFDSKTLSLDNDWYIDLILKEHEGYMQLWEGQYGAANEIYSELSEQAKKYDIKLSAWYHHWQGLSLLCFDNKQEANKSFIKSSNIFSEFGRPNIRQEHISHYTRQTKVNSQAIKLAKLYRNNKDIANLINKVESDLCYGEKTKKAEEACKNLGILLGLQADRPDKTTHTGPDVIWKIDKKDSLVCGFELKTDKDKNGEYFKKEIGQCHNHAQWLSDKYDNNQLIIVGHLLPVSNQANPSPNLKIIELSALLDLLSRIKEVISYIDNTGENNLENIFQNELDYYGLNWPICLESLPSKVVIDLKNSR